jgi:hypothetical protein
MKTSNAQVRNATRWRQAGALVALLCLASCGDPPTAPTPPARMAIEGTWTGTIADRNAGTAQLSISLSGIEPIGLGTFSLTFPDPAANTRGVLQGRTHDAPTIELVLFVDAGGRNCSGVAGISYVARLALTGNRMTGTYSPAVACPLLGGGSMELTRQ